MTPDLERTWTAIENTMAGVDEGFIRRRLTKERDDGLFAAVDAKSKQRNFMISYPGPIKRIEGIPNWREIVIEQRHDPEKRGNIIILIRLVNRKYTDVFTALCNDLYRTLADIGHRKSVLAPLIDRLVKWHRFMMEHGPSGLSHEEQQGLFGEVWLLQEKILTLMPSFDAIGSWKGPEGSPHDFILPRGNLEVKSLEESSSIQISSEFQLDGSCVKSLKLAVLGLREVDTGGITLPTLIENTRKRIEVNKEAGSLFEKRLLQAGYLDEHKGNYSSNYQVKDLMLFDIVDGFPRIIKPATGVKSVRYELELSFCQKYRTDPSEAITALVKEE